MFIALKWGHLFTFVVQILIIFFKHHEFYNMGQFLQSAVVPFGYLPMLFYGMYLIRQELDEWKGNIN